MTRMSKKLYIGLLIFTFVLLFLCGLPALFLLNSYDIPRSMGIDDDLTNLLVGVLIFLSIAPFLFTQIILSYVLIYKMWSSIQGGRFTRTSPGKAVGFLFIPFFNLYWLFQVWGGFPTDYNQYLDEHSLPLPKLSQGLYIAYPISILLPLVSILLAPLVLIFVTAQTCDAVNRLADAKRA
jgi:hypothetical protein